VFVAYDAILVTGCGPSPLPDEPFEPAFTDFKP